MSWPWSRRFPTNTPCGASLPRVRLAPECMNGRELCPHPRSRREPKRLNGCESSRWSTTHIDKTRTTTIRRPRGRADARVKDSARCRTYDVIPRRSLAASLQACHSGPEAMEPDLRRSSGPRSVARCTHRSVRGSTRVTSKPFTSGQQRKALPSRRMVARGPWMATRDISRRIPSHQVIDLYSEPLSLRLVRE